MAKFGASSKMKGGSSSTSFVLGSRPGALRSPRLGSNSGISIKPQTGVTQYGKQMAANNGIPSMGGVGFGNTAKTGES